VSIHGHHTQSASSCQARTGTPPRARLSAPAEARKADIFRDTGEKGGRGRPFNAVDFARVLRFLKDGRPLGLEEARGLIKKCGTTFPWFLAQR